MNHFERLWHILHCCAEALYSAYGFSESAIMAARQIGLALPCTTNMHRTETPVRFVQGTLFIFLVLQLLISKVQRRQNLSDLLGFRPRTFSHTTTPEAPLKALFVAGYGASAVSLLHHACCAPIPVAVNEEV